MPSPVAHSLVGLAIAGAFQRPLVKNGCMWLVYGVIGGNAADLDVVAGLLVGDINRHHQGISHSLLFAVGFGVLTAALWGGRGLSRPSALLFGLFLYASHPALDYFAVDGRAPFGVPLLWPLSGEHFMTQWPIVRGMRHGVPGDDLATFFRGVFHPQNGVVVVVETVVLAPVVLLTWFVAKWRANHGSR